MVVLFTNYFSSQEKNENNDNTVQSVYQPSKTVIKGEEVKKKKYEDDAKIIKIMRTDVILMIFNTDNHIYSQFIKVSFAKLVNIGLIYYLCNI